MSNERATAPNFAPSRSSGGQNERLDAMDSAKSARTLCRMIGGGAILTGVVMVVFSRDVVATSDSTVVDAVVHVSNLKFMAAMWCVTGAMFAVGASHLHENGTWRLLRLGCIGISTSALVRLVEMARLESYSSYGVAAALVELVVPGCLIYLRNRSYPGKSR